MEPHFDITLGDVIRSIVEAYSFVDLGLVKSVDGRRVGVEPFSKPGTLVPDVEMLTLSAGTFSIVPLPSVNDLVLLVSTKEYIEESTTTVPELVRTRTHFGMENYKALQLSSLLSAKATLEADADGKLTMTTPMLKVNGDSKSFVTWEQLNTALGTLCTTLAAHVHPSNGAVSPGLVALACDISAAKTTTVKTGG
jgi:hypothetical protein